MASDNEVGTMKLSCACGKDGKALDYAPPPCTDLKEYDLKLGEHSMLTECEDSTEAWAVNDGVCVKLDGCSHALNAFGTQSECETKCIEGAL
jgi:hypothetical protein